MEDEKKKKRNKKKKNNKQTKTTTDDVAVGADPNHLINGQKDDVRSQASEPADIQNVQVDADRHQSNGAESANLAEAERQHLLQREAILEETVKHLRNERESHIQKEATLEGTVQQLQNECDLYKEKVATLEETIQQLQRKNDLRMQKEGGLEMNIAKLQSEKEFWLQKEAALEQKISQLRDESAALNMKRATLIPQASLEERLKLLEADKDSWTQMESVSKETIAGLSVDITQLRMQVVELEESRNNLLQENHQLKENVSSLRSQLSSDESKKLQHATSEQKDFSTQIEAAGALIDKLITENIELVEKVNDLAVKLDRQSVAAGLSSAIGSDAVTTLTSDTEPMSESSDNMSSLNNRLETQGVVAVKEDRNGINGVHADPPPLVLNSSEADYSGEIVQIPLDDKEVQDLELQVVESDTDKVASVPLTDAPLIGAPFRLVSFVAKYVSGADLVNKNASN
ncbi:mitochondrial ATP synthase D chain-related protein [Citrus sinensis]|uniref:Mitochondrial ATP synthase D chain-related protein n=1 Tax=Citrus sinensis TaxID=2711 RepID=A0ACB8JZ86_CITSI|nr:mitochondrial ATP synthase D chain-related protein [Citrus sinensis]